MILGGKIKQGSGIYNKYPSTSTFDGKKVLNLGCGFAKFQGANIVNLDAFDNCQPDVKWDLSVTPLPFKDESFDFIIANHILEHVPNWWNIFVECARILKPGGRLEIWGPGMGSDGVMGFRDHLNTINQCSFFGIFGMNRGNNAWASANTDDYAASLKLINTDLRLYQEWWIQKAPKRLQMWMANHLRNVIYEIGFLFQKQHSVKPKLDIDYRVVEALL